jgi:LuxR family maltose regulon positive regulatory protein
VPDWALQRPRITEMIAQGAQRCPLTVATGPVGAGKTMALALWAAAESRPVAWVSLDEYNNRPGAFWPSIVAALRRSGVAIPRSLTAAPQGRAAEHSSLVRLASVLTAQNPPVTLVIDDVHLLTELPVLTGLDFLLGNTGIGLRLAVSSRTDPPLPLHRYRLAGELTEIGPGIWLSTWPRRAGSPGASCQRTRLIASWGEQRAGRPCLASQPCPWPLTLIPAGSSPNWPPRRAP